MFPLKARKHYILEQLGKKEEEKMMVLNNKLKGQ